MNDMAPCAETPRSSLPLVNAPPVPAWRQPWLIVALTAIGLAGWQWIETRQRLGDMQQEVARRLADGDGVARESQALARQTQEQLTAVLGKLGALESRLAESQSQQAMLESLYQDLARNRDEWALAEVEQNVTMAAQQLQLSGNVSGAILALAAADARLAGNSRPQFIGLRKVLGRDLDRLRALPAVDLPGMSLRLESIIVAIDLLPLVVDGRPKAETRSKPLPAETLPATSLGYWQRLGADFWSEIRNLIRIQRFDRDEPALLAPGQSFFLRENLKLRLLNARLALLARDQWTFRNELKHAQAWIERYFDAHDQKVQTAQGSLRQMTSAELLIDLPSLNDSVSAIKNFKLGKDRK